MPDAGVKGTSRKPIRTHVDVEVYQSARDTAMDVFEVSKAFPREEIFSLTSQVRRSSRAVAVNSVEAWRKRRYEAAFIAKLSDAETEAAETQVHVEFAVRCGYLNRTEGARLYRRYERIIKTLVGMIQFSDRWITKDKRGKQ